MGTLKDCNKNDAFTDDFRLAFVSFNFPTCVGISTKVEVEAVNFNCFEAKVGFKGGLANLRVRSFHGRISHT